MTDGRQTDNATEKCVAIGRIACARAIPLKNWMTERCTAFDDYSLIFIIVQLFVSDVAYSVSSG